MTNDLTWTDFMKLDMRIGTIIDAQSFPEARKPAYKLVIDFGSELGKMKTSAQITDTYSLEQLVGKQVVAVVNFPPKQIGNFMSECLVLGSIDSAGHVTLLQPERDVTNGDRVG
jgi:tRNA-binding protein